MKLNKEQVYINLQGKTKEELTDLYWLLKNNNEPLTRERLNYFIEYPLEYRYISLDKESWNGYEGLNNLEYKTEVTIDQLKQIIKPMETKFTPIAMKCTQEQFDAVKMKLVFYKTITGKFEKLTYLCNNLDGKDKIIGNIYPDCKKDYNRTVHEEWNEEIFLKACGIDVKPKFKKGDSVVMNSFETIDMSSSFSLNKPYKVKDVSKNSVIWLVDNNDRNHGIPLDSAIKMNMQLCIETLQQELQKAEAEVKRLQYLIEEENKPKVGDWCYFYDDTNKESKVIGKLSEFTTLYYTGDFNFDRCEKITNPELIKLLEDEIK